MTRDLYPKKIAIQETTARVKVVNSPRTSTKDSVEWIYCIIIDVIIV